MDDCLLAKDVAEELGEFAIGTPLPPNSGIGAQAKASSFLSCEEFKKRLAIEPSMLGKVH